MVRFIMAATIAGLTLGALVGVADDHKAISAERYYPDPDALFPGPRAPSPAQQPRVIEAEQIILRGRDVSILIAASGNRPGITMVHRSGWSQQMYFGEDGKAVIGIRSPGQDKFSAAIWATEEFGVLQMRDARGTYTMRPHELHAPGVRQ